MSKGCKVKILMAGFIVLFKFSVVFSQNMSTTPTFGIKGGALMSTINGDKAIDQFAKKIGPQIGVTAAYYVHPMLAIRGELNYEAKGGKFANHDMSMNLHYVTLPIYLKFNFTRDPEIYIYAGGYASYLVAAKTKGTYEIIIGDDFISESVNEDITPNITKVDVGLVAGLGVQGRFSRWLDLFLDFRYSQGFMNLDNNTADLRYNFNHEPFWPEQDLNKPKNKAFMLTTGFIFFLDPR